MTNREPALAPLRLIMVRGTVATLDTAYRTQSFDAFTDSIACPACGCMKSGDLADANRRQECCDLNGCPCHDEDACVMCGHVHTDDGTPAPCPRPACPCAVPAWSELELRYAYGDR